LINCSHMSKNFMKSTLSNFIVSFLASNNF
jgi:hypothetical protein